MGRKLHRISQLLLAVMMLSLFAVTAMAGEARLHSLDVDIALHEDGSAHFVETRVVVFEGEDEFTRYGFGNALPGPRVVTDWSVTMDGETLTMLDEPDNDSRPENTFAVQEGDGEHEVYIYHRSTDVIRTFQISYRVENAVKLYDDVADFFWNLTGEGGLSSVGRVTARLTIPEGVPEEEFRIWAHGPLNGTFVKDGPAAAVLAVEYVSWGEIVDLRAAMPAEFFTGGWVHEGEALPDILEKEKELAAIANAKREEQAQEDAKWEAYWAQRDAWAEEHPILASIQSFCEGIYDFFYYNVIDQLVGVVGFIGVWVFGLIALFGRNKSNPEKVRHKSAQAPEYYRELPDDRPAPVVDWLLHFYNGRSSISREVSAALLELDLKKLVRFESDGRDTQMVLSPSREEFPPAQRYLALLWDFLREASGDRGRVSVKELKAYVKENREAAYSFKSSFESAVGEEFRRGARTQCIEGPGLFQRKKLLLTAVAAGIFGLLVRMGSTLYDGVDVGAALAVGGLTLGSCLIIVLVYHLGRKLAGDHCYILDRQGEQDLALWQAFGRFLDDFTTFDRKELPEFPVWRWYMVYAVAMGKGKKVAKALTVQYPEAMSTALDSDYDMFRNMALYDTLDAIGREVDDIRSPSSTSSGSDDGGDSWSDGSGGGGGFSSSGGGSDSGSRGDFAD